MAVILFNPKATTFHYRIPNSILSLAASIEGKFDYVIVDGNRETDPWSVIERYLETKEFRYFCCTVMPGPQLAQAVPFSREIHRRYPDTTVIWGGYFPSNHSRVVLESGYVDYVVRGPGDKTLPLLLHALEGKRPIDQIPNVIYVEGGNVTINRSDPIPDPDKLPTLPYGRLNQFYPMDRYLWKTYLGNKTIAYHSSFGCPFTCSFCAVVPIYEARWKGKSAPLIYEDIKYLKETYGGDAIEFHDNNFFVSEKRVLEFARLIQPEAMGWWGEGRVDTLDHYADDSLHAIKEAGCRMIFFGAETGNDRLLQQMHKGGTQTGGQLRKFAARLGKIGIVPEYSFVLGTPAPTEAEVWEQLIFDVRFIKEIKEINPDTEIIIYLYSPVPTEGSDLFSDAQARGFRFPATLDEWQSAQWQNFDLRKNPLTPWLTADMVDYVRDFETVLNARYPTRSDIKLTAVQKSVMRGFSWFRYHAGVYRYPYQLKFLQKKWLETRQPETEGF